MLASIARRGLIRQIPTTGYNVGTKVTTYPLRNSRVEGLQVGAVAKRMTSTTASTETVVAQPERYALSSRWLHWLQAFATIGAIGSVTYAQGTPKTPEGNKAKTDAMFAHKSFGTFIFFTIPIRILTRLVTKGPPHLPSPFLVQLGANAAHMGLYGGLLFMSVSGVGMAYASGKPIPFFFTTINTVANPPDGATAKELYGWHKRIGFWWKFLVPLHVAGAGYHVVRGQRIFNRMNPFV